MGKKSSKKKRIEDLKGMKNALNYYLEIDENFKKEYEYSKLNGYHIHSATLHYPPEWQDYDNLKKEVLQSYYSFTNKTEAERVFQPDNLSDYLLKQRLESILANMRIQRVFHKKAAKIKTTEWSLENQFDDSIFGKFKESVNDKFKDKVQPYLCGSVYSTDPNAWCERSEYGDLVVISETLQKFLYFMAIGFLPLTNSKCRDLIHPDTSVSSIMIALRIMIESESVDFELDPRGKIPKQVDAEALLQVERMLMFVIGHEFGHIFKGHLDSSLLRSKNYAKEPATIYSQSQDQEFEADLHAIEIVSGESVSRDEILMAGLQFFLFLDLLEYFTTDPETAHESSHPTSIDRYNRLLNIIKNDWQDHPNLKILERYNFYSNHVRPKIEHQISLREDILTFYGSLYLTQWRTKELIDRKDF